MGFLSWSKQPSPGQKRAMRYTRPGIVACYWDGMGPMAHAVKDVSSTGAYLYTKDRWSVGTIMVITLREESEGLESTATPGSVSIPCRVVRHGPDGVGVSFVLHLSEDRKALKRFLSATAYVRGSGSALGLEVAAKQQTGFTDPQRS